MFFLDFPVLPQDVPAGQVDILNKPVPRIAAWNRTSAGLFCETHTVTVSDIPQASLMDVTL